MTLIATLWACPFIQFSTCLLIQPIFEQLLCEDSIGDNVKGLTEVQLDYIHCSPPIYQASHFVLYRESN